MKKKGRFFSIAKKLTLINVALPIATMITATVFTIHTINGFIVRQAQDKIVNDLNSAREIYKAQLDAIEETLHRGAISYALVHPLTNRNAQAIRREMQGLLRRNDLTILTLTDATGRVVMRAANPSLKDDRPRFPLLARALTGISGASTEIMTRKELERENPLLGHLIDIRLISTPKARKTDVQRLDSGMAMLAAWPVYDGVGNLIGVLYGGKLLNHDNSLVDKIKAVVFSTNAMDGTSTLFQDDVRIATNVLDSSGNRAIGTRVSAEVYEKVVQNRQRWSDRAFVVNDWYISAYEPIYNSLHRVIGILYVGMKETPFIALRKKILTFLTIIPAIGIILILLVAFYFASQFARRITNLTSELDNISQGNYRGSVVVQGNDEVSQLSERFNEMIATLAQRNESIEALHRGLQDEVKNRTADLEARNRELLEIKQHLLEMMADKRVVNQRLEESLESLRKAQQQLIRSGKLAALGTLVAGIAHEINNPVAIVSGNLELLAMDTEVRQKFAVELEIIVSQMRKIKGLIENMLPFSRIKQSDLQKIDINEVMKQVIGPFIPQINAARIVVETDLKAQKPLLSDEASLNQIFTNLVTNSLQAMSAQEGGHLRITTRDEGDCVEVVISDTGCGMTQEQVENMFNPFYSTKPKGYGLGLAIGHELLSCLGGAVNVESAPQEGTSITILLPLDPSVGRTAPCPDSTLRPYAGKQTERDRMSSRP